MEPDRGSTVADASLSGSTAQASALIGSYRSAERSCTTPASRPARRTRNAPTTARSCCRTMCSPRSPGLNLAFDALKDECAGPPTRSVRRCRNCPTPTDTADRTTTTPCRAVYCSVPENAASTPEEGRRGRAGRGGDGRLDCHPHVFRPSLGHDEMWRRQAVGMHDVDLVHTEKPGRPRQRPTARHQALCAHQGPNGLEEDNPCRSSGSP